MFCGEDLLAVFEDGISGYRFVFVGAEDESYGRVVAVDFELILEETNIPVHLADIAMGEFSDLQVYQDETEYYLSVFYSWPYTDWHRFPFILINSSLNLFK